MEKTKKDQKEKPILEIMLTALFATWFSCGFSNSMLGVEEPKTWRERIAWGIGAALPFWFIICYLIILTARLHHFSFQQLALYLSIGFVMSIFFGGLDSFLVVRIQRIGRAVANQVIARTKK